MSKEIQNKRCILELLLAPVLNVMTGAEMVMVVMANKERQRGLVREMKMVIFY